MKVIAINGSPNKKGNTFHALNMVGNELEANGIGFEILHIGHKMIHGCTACGKCAVNKDAEGKQIMRVLGKNMSWLLKMKEYTADTIEPPKKEKKEYTNFIR